ncbi:MAG: DNA integrity scanning diadenylate cyclase DisA [Bowdeniella nasicola]|nr:DNA integrity scanning diadenylate cyclase DisA [Bowdeniella nasicola]
MTAHDLRSTLARVAPGSELRDGLERILRGRTGALIVLGDNETVGAICSGGFNLNVPFTATRLRELAKMDGGVVLDSSLTKITRANVQLLPASDIPTTETGMRHRTADRVAKQTGFPVISVSQSMNIIALYVAGGRHVLENSDAISSRANEALSTLERYRARLDQVLTNLTALELTGYVTVGDVAAAMQRMEMVVRIWREIESYVIELGTDGRLLNLQLDELVSGVEKDIDLVLTEYSRVPPDQVAEELGQLTSNELMEIQAVAAIMGLGSGALGTDEVLQPRGVRLIAKIPRLPSAVVEALAAHFSTVDELLGATASELQEVEGVGPLRARAIHDGLRHLADTTIFARR